MPRRHEAAQDAPPKLDFTLGAAHARYVIALLLTLLGYGGNEIRTNDRERSELIERHDHAEDVMTRRIEALEDRLRTCGH